MKRIYLMGILLLTIINLQAQTRKHSASFPLLKQYFNPALTGFEGSVINGLYRSQWSSFEGAPSTFYLATDLSMADLREKENTTERKGEMSKNPTNPSTRHAFGLSFLKDSFGPYYEHQLYLSYSSSLKLTSKISLGAGATLSYNMEGMDAHKINMEQSNDPFVQQYMQNSRNGRLDMNLGMALSGENFYLGYAMHDVTKGAAQFNKETDVVRYTYKHIFQAGYRVAVSEQFGVVANGVYQYDQVRGGNMEGQLKGVFCNKVWLGVAYRHRLAYSFNVGLQLQKVKVGYAYEVPTGDAQLAMQTSELMLSYQLGSASKTLSNSLSIW